MINMKTLIKNIFSLIGFFTLTQLSSADAIEIIYPKQNPAVINASSTFFIGNTIPGSILTINGLPVKVWENGSFVQVVPLTQPENLFKIISNLDEKNDETTFIIKKNAVKIPQKCEEEYIPVPNGEFLYSAVSKDNTPLRCAPDENAQRLTHLSKDTVLFLEGKKGGFYKVYLGDNNSCWIAENTVNISENVKTPVLSDICSTNFEDDDNYDYLKMNVTVPVPYMVKENGSNLELTIFCINNSDKLLENISSQKLFKKIEIIENSNNKIVLSFPTTEQLWGYDCYNDCNQLVFKKRKTPSIDIQKPLNNITIAIDAGHGGADSGAVGPTGEKEKNINLDIAKKLEKELKKAGANVIMIREKDENTDLYERVRIAKNSNALLCLSIHANALPDGADPYKQHGTSTYYYHNQAKELAHILKLQLMQDLGTNDDGYNKASFVMTRATSPLSVLVEVAYMIHPQEYQLLLDNDFRQKAAQSIKNGIERYLLQAAKIE